MRIEILDSNKMSKPLEFRHNIMKEAFGVENDFDKWDCVAKHLCCYKDEDIVGYYRIIEHTEMGFYTESEFNIDGLEIEKNKILEIGRACITPSAKNPSIITSMWAAIIDYAKKRDKQYIIGSASLQPYLHNVAKCRDAWRKKYNYLQGKHAVPIVPFNDKWSMDTEEDTPHLIKVYEKVGAKIVSDPSYDAIFDTADVVTLLNIEEINQRWLTRLTVSK